MRHTSILALAIASTIVLGGRSATAQTPPSALPLLDWMKPGTRITYYDSKGTMTNFAVELVPDEHGEWHDRKTKERFKEDMMAKLEGGTGGYGYRQHDVIAVEDGTLAVDIKSFSIRPDLNAAIQVPGGQGLAGTLERTLSLHVHPRLLAAALAEAEANPPKPGELAPVYRTEMKLGERTCKAIRMVSRGAGGYVQQTYDLESGLMLLETSATTVAGYANEDLVHKKDGRRYDGRGATVVTYTRLVSVRELKLPQALLRAQIAPLFAQGGQMLWQGGYRMIVPGAENLPVPPTPCAFSASVRQAGRGYSLVEVSDVSNPNLPLPAGTRVIGPANLGAGWMVAPSLLRTLKPDQVLDRDEVTRSELICVGQGQDGLIWIGDRGPQHDFGYGYDARTGICRRMVLTLRPSRLVYEMQLVEQR